MSGDDEWVVGHKLARITHPELTWTVSNWRHEHRACSDRTGQAAVIERAQRTALAAAGIDPDSVLPHRTTPGQPPLLPSLSPSSQGGPGGALADLLAALPDTEVTIRGQRWTESLWPLPEDAALPLAMSGPHPRAVGSYGPNAIEWVRDELGVELRWWQALAVCRQLEHDAAGQLVWREVVESAPRRSGKSVRLRVVALWRIAHAELIGETQEVMLTSKDLPVAKEIIRPAWAWASDEIRKEDGWTVRRGNGDAEVASPEGDRWLIRATDAVYGYSPGCAMADESWGIPPNAISDGLEPSLLDRISPQLVLTSTAHPRASSLMRRRLLNALRGTSENTLLLLWGAHPDADPGDPRTWRAASPMWTQDRAQLMAEKYAAALAGEADPEFDDLSPMESFTSQYANIWPQLDARASLPGDPVVTEDVWSELATTTPADAPSSAAVESSFGAGVSVALAWRVGSTAIVSVTEHPDLSAAAEHVRAARVRGTITVGASLTDDPAFKGMTVKPGTCTARSVAMEIKRITGDGTLRHDGTQHLAGQVLALRTSPGTDGPRLRSTGRHDAVKAALWAAATARRIGAGKPRILLPTGARDTN